MRHVHARGQVGRPRRPRRRFRLADSARVQGAIRPRRRQDAPARWLAHQGARRRAGDDLRVRRLRVPPLRSGRAGPRRCDGCPPGQGSVGLQELHAPVPRARRACGALGVRGRGARKVLGDGAPALRAPAAPRRRGPRALRGDAQARHRQVEGRHGLRGGEDARRRRPQAGRGPQPEGHADDLRERARARRGRGRVARRARRRRARGPAGAPAVERSTGRAIGRAQGAQPR